MSLLVCVAREFIAILVLAGCHGLVCALHSDGGPEYNRPFQVVKPTENHTSMVVTDGLMTLQRHEKPVALIAVVGPYHSGKSFLLNTLLGDLKAFSIGPKTSPETMGIWLCRTNMTTASGAEVWLMDSEGFFGPGIVETYDAKVFTIATLLGAHLVYNTVKIIDQQAVRLLEMLARNAQLFRTRSSAVASRSEREEPEFLSVKSFPPLTWVVEDFVQDIPEEHRKEGATGWLKTYLSKANETIDHNSPNEYFLSKLYQGLHVHTLFLPATSRDQLRDLSKLQWSQLTQEFQQEVTTLKSKILGSLQPRRFQGAGMTGHSLSKTLHFIVKALQRGRFPELPTIWNTWLEQVAKMSLDDADKSFVYQLEQIDDLSQDVPVSIAFFNSKLDAARDTSIDFYNELLHDFDVFPRTAELDQLMEVRFQHALSGYHERILRWAAGLVVQFKENFQSSFLQKELPVDPVALEKTGQALSQNATTNLAKIIDDFANPGPLLKSGWMAKMPAFTTEPVDKLDAEIQSILNDRKSQNEKEIQSILKNGFTAADAAVDKELKVASAKLCGKARMHEVRTESRQKAWQAFHNVLTEYPWMKTLDYMYNTQKNAVSDMLEDKLQKFTSNNEQKLDTFFKSLFDKIMGQYKMHKQKMVRKMPLDEVELRSEHDALYREALDMLMIQDPGLVDTDAYAAQRKRLEASINEELVLTEKKNVEVLKVHSDEATRCALNENRNMVKRSGLLGLVNKIPFLYKNKAWENFQRCFSKSEAGSAITRHMQERVFESWYDKDLAHDVQQVWNNCYIILFTGAAILLGMTVLCRSRPAPVYYNGQYQPNYMSGPQYGAPPRYGSPPYGFKSY